MKRKVLVTTMALAMGCTNVLAADTTTGKLADIIGAVETAVSDLQLLGYNSAINVEDIDGSVLIQGATAFGIQDLTVVGSTFVQTTGATVDYGDLVNKIETTGIGAYNNGEALGVTADITRNLNSASLITSFCGTQLCSEPAFTYDTTSGNTGSAIAALPETVAFNLAYNAGAVASGIEISAVNSVETVFLDTSATDTTTTTTTYLDNDLNNLQLATTAIGAYNAGSINLNIKLQELVSGNFGNVPNL